jgi:hypothetical protein
MVLMELAATSEGVREGSPWPEASERLCTRMGDVAGAV